MLHLARLDFSIKNLLSQHRKHGQFSPARSRVIACYRGKERKGLSLTNLLTLNGVLTLNEVLHLAHDDASLFSVVVQSWHPFIFNIKRTAVLRVFASLKTPRDSSAAVIWICIWIPCNRPSLTNLLRRLRQQPPKQPDRVLEAEKPLGRGSGLQVWLNIR